jgi:hypothetical protein
MMRRRLATIGGLAMMVAPSLPRAGLAQGGRPMLVFVGHELWGGCKIWRAQYEPSFLKSEAFRKLDYRVVHPASADLILQEENWPADARWILVDFLMSDEGAQRGYWTPRFILAQDSKIVFTTTGVAGWTGQMWPRIQEVTGTAS